MASGVMAVGESMKRYLVREGQKVDLDEFDPDDTSLLEGGKADAKERLLDILERLTEAQGRLFAGHERRLLIVLQGMDTSGTAIVKFFLHIGREEQRNRLQARLNDPKKCWKFQAGDLEERKFWSAPFWQRRWTNCTSSIPSAISRMWWWSD